MKPLSGVDSLFLHLETPDTPMHVASSHLYQLPEGFKGDFLELARKHLATRIPHIALMRRKLAHVPLDLANPVWVDDDEVDLTYHVRRVKLPRPGTMAQFENALARLHAKPMDRSRPLWEFYVIEGLSDRKVGFYSKVHHAALDGAAGVILLSTMLDTTPVPRKFEPRKSKEAEHPGVREVVGAALGHETSQLGKLLRHLPDAVKFLAGAARPSKALGVSTAMLKQNFSFGPKTPFNVAITRERGFSALSLPLAECKAIAAAEGVKLNDVVLAICAGALRRYLDHHGGIPKKPLVAAVPVSLREAGNTEYTTQATMTLVSLATNISDPVKRLRAIHESANAAKALTAGMRSVIPMDFPSLGIPWIVSGLASLYGRAHVADRIPPIANLVISNIHGYDVPVYLAGARMLTYWPMSIVEHGLGLNITLESYAGSLDFGLVAAKNAVPNVREVAEAIEASFEELKEATRGGAAAAAQPKRATPAKRPAPRAGAQAPAKKRRAAPAAAGRKRVAAARTSRKAKR
ncbi:MAG: wax ester/triacylglycerol synthase family O-acyltransferase [Burkholderiales bacterium]|nr:wax ester/triacylglycerol synthase family O-acyltransferase [Burkholderiales bacterium]